MGFTQATQALISLGLLLLFLRTMNGLFFQVVCIMLRLALVGAALLLLPLNLIDTWAAKTTESANLAPVAVPVIAVLAITALNLDNLPFIKGDIEKILRILIYVIAGTFTAGSVAWVNLDKSAALIVGGIFGMATAVLEIFRSVLTGLSS